MPPRFGAVMVGLLVLSSVGHTAQAAPPSSLIVFGDSLSDTGNFFGAVGGTFPIVPPYAAGRFTNGPTWVEGLATQLGLAATASSAGGTNFAFAAAGTGTGFSPSPTDPAGPTFVPNMREQVNGYLGTNTPTGDELFVVWGGANDFLLNGETDPIGPATNIAAIVGDLYAAGARRFLVPNLPPMGLTPGAAAQGQAAVDALNALTSGFNTTLAASLDSLEPLAGITIHRLDVASLFGQVGVLGPAAGITVFDQPYAGLFTGVVNNPALDEDAFLFFDEIHPTRVTHGLLAQEAVAALPEPTSLALLAMGAAVVAGRRRVR